MAASGPIVLATMQGIEVRGRRRLDGKFEAMLEELSSKLEVAASSEKGAVVSDLDISQNNVSFEQFEALFSQLGAHNARVQRFRMFGMPTLNDEVCRVLSDHLRLLNNESAPTEMHLSDCAITAEGWHHLMGVIEESELYPVSFTRGAKPAPLYLRLENNYIDQDAIKEKIDSGVVRAYKKHQGTGMSRMANSDEVKVNLVARNDGTVAQKTGEPPAPEDAPAPKPVWDKQAQNAAMVNQMQANQQTWTQPQTQWRGPTVAHPAVRPLQANMAFGGCGGFFGGKGGCKGGMGMVRPVAPMMMRTNVQPQQAWVRTPMQPPSRVATPATGMVRPQVRPGMTTASGAGIKNIIKPLLQRGQMTAPAAAAQRPVVRGSVGKGPGGAAGVHAAATTFGRAGGAADRSRTPAARGGAAAMQPLKPPPQKDALPYPWEEHYSDEYSIPYFWNAETGDSAWERPKA